MIITIVYRDNGTEIGAKSFTNKSLAFNYAAEMIAFNDIYPREFMYGIVVDENTKEVRYFDYIGWQPGMIIEFRYNDNREIAHIGSYSEWDH